MSKAITTCSTVDFSRKRHGEKKVVDGKSPKPVPSPRIPRISRLMALAIRFETLICTGEVTDQAELARLGQVSRARLTQIMDLLNLAPDIQEAVLFSTGVAKGREAVTERQLRPIVAEFDWGKQREMWAREKSPA